MAGMRHAEFVVEPFQKKFVFHQLFMLVNAEQLFAEQALAHAVIMIQRGLRAPADKDRAGNVFPCEFEYFLEFGPVFHLLEIDGFHGCARNDHAVEFPPLYLAERFVKAVEVFERGVFSRVRFRTDERNVDLQRRIGQKPHELRFRNDLGRHQI